MCRYQRFSKIRSHFQTMIMHTEVYCTLRGRINVPSHTVFSMQYQLATLPYCMSHTVQLCALLDKYTKFIQNGYVRNVMKQSHLDSMLDHMRGHFLPHPYTIRTCHHTLKQSEYGNLTLIDLAVINCSLL